MDVVSGIFGGFLAIVGVGVVAVGVMIGFTLVVYSVGAAHYFLTAPSDVRRKFENDWSGAKEGKPKHFEQGRVLIVSSRGVLFASVAGLITSLLIFAYLASGPHSTLDMQTFVAGILSALVSLAVVGYAIGIYFGARGKAHDTKKK